MVVLGDIHRTGHNYKVLAQFWFSYKHAHPTLRRHADALNLFQSDREKKLKQKRMTQERPRNGRNEFETSLKNAD